MTENLSESHSEGREKPYDLEKSQPRNRPEARSPLARKILTLVRDPHYRPLRRSEMARALNLAPSDRAELRQCLKTLNARGDVIRTRGNRYAHPEPGEEWCGILKVHPRGFGFVADEDHPEREAYIPKTRLHNALHGDRVRVSVQPSAPRSGRSRRPPPTRPASNHWRGQVTDVLRRSVTEVVGTLQQTPYYACVIPDDPRYTQNIRIRTTGRPLPDAGRKVVVRLDAWDPDASIPQGRITEDVGDADDPALALTGVLRKHGIESSFSTAVDQQARSHRGTLEPGDAEGREDWRDCFALTIDPEDAKDFDDAVSLRHDPDGSWRLGVHIADVAHFVPPGSEIDREAARRGTSVYLTDRAVSMLPPYLTTEICSLQPGRDRLAHSVELRFAPDGTRLDARTFPSVIRSRVRLNYREVQTFFNQNTESDWPDETGAVLRSMRKLAALLRAHRMSAGALAMQTPEIKCRMAPDGRVAAIERCTEGEAYRVIEEFMLQANQAVAERLGSAPSPCLYRIHEEPGEAQWEDMEQDLRNLGFPLQRRTREELNRVLGQSSETPVAYPVTLAVLRNLKRAVYAPHHRPHFGLALSAYTHFTSPIRRYPDLVTHRLLRAAEQKAPPPYRHPDLKDIGAHCSQREQEADEAERESTQIKRTEYYAELLAAGNTGPWTATVVSVLPRGLMLEIPETLQRGLLPFSLLPGGHYRASADRNTVRGRGPAGGIRVGDTVPVRLSRVDTRRRQIDFRCDATGKNAR